MQIAKYNFFFYEIEIIIIKRFSPHSNNTFNLDNLTLYY